MITDTIDVYELVWTLAALPGLWFWIGNRLEAGLDAKAAACIVPRNGRYLWARFSVFLTNTFIGIEVLFVLIGIAAMTRPAAPADGQPNLYRLVLIIGLISASAVITMLAYRWRQVNTEIVNAARTRQRGDNEPRDLRREDDPRDHRVGDDSRDLRGGIDPRDFRGGADPRDPRGGEDVPDLRNSQVDDTLYCDTGSHLREKCPRG